MRSLAEPLAPLTLNLTACSEPRRTLFCNQFTTKQGWRGCGQTITSSNKTAADEWWVLTADCRVIQWTRLWFQTQSRLCSVPPLTHHPLHLPVYLVSPTLSPKRGSWGTSILFVSAAAGVKGPRTPRTDSCHVGTDARHHHNNKPVPKVDYPLGTFHIVRSPVFESSHDTNGTSYKLKKLICIWNLTINVNTRISKISLNSFSWGGFSDLSMQNYDRKSVTLFVAITLHLTGRMGSHNQFTSSQNYARMKLRFFFKKIKLQQIAVPNVKTFYLCPPQSGPRTRRFYESYSLCTSHCWTPANRNCTVEVL